MIVAAGVPSLIIWPGTPESIQVDNFGCPIDSDNDSVPVYLDECPETPPDTKVTSDDCSANFHEYVFNVATLFNSGEAILTAKAYAELVQVVGKIKLRPHSNWRIEGHSNSMGGYEYNKKLSLLRAEAV